MICSIELRNVLRLTTVLAALLCPYSAPCQTDDPDSVAYLVKFLAYGTDERRWRPEIFTCGGENAERRAATSLAQRGESALAVIEPVLRSLVEKGERSEYALSARWILMAYARIKAEDAVPRLRQIYNVPRIPMGLSLDTAFAIALGLTSYVSDLREDIGGACRPDEPREALDRLLIALKEGQRSQIESVLGANARAKFKDFIKGRDWREVRREIWPRQAGAVVGVGYRFQLAGTWADPDESLREGGRWQRGDAERLTSELEITIDTLFHDGSGKPFGRRPVRFAKASAEDPFDKYHVNNEDLGELILTIAACASPQSGNSKTRPSQKGAEGAQ